MKTRASGTSNGRSGAGVPLTALAPIVISALALIISACNSDHDSALAAKSRRVFGTLPATMPGTEHDTPQMVALGRELFVSNELSVNRSQSCHSCHRLDGAGVDRLATSPGALGAPGSRNTPTVINAGLHAAQFWDGRAMTLEEQASAPILNPVEMAMPSEQAVVERLRQPRFRELFAAAFPDATEPVTMENVSKAIAAFQRTLISRDRFDAFMNGEHDALTAEEKRGLTVFMKTGCASCHGGPLLGGNIFQKLGIVHQYENDADIGRAAVTNRNRDRFVFKVPALRNVALSGPYFHDGSIDSLPKAVERMAWLQLGHELPQEDGDAIVAFLEALSDTSGVTAIELDQEKIETAVLNTVE